MRFKDFVKGVGTVVGGAAIVAKRGLSKAANVTHRASSAIESKQDVISRVTGKVVAGSGKAVGYAGDLVLIAGADAGAAVRRQFGDGAVSKVLEAGALTVAIGGLVLQKLGSGTEKISSTMGATVGAGAAGAATMASQTLDGVAIRPTDIDVLRAELVRHGKAAAMRSVAAKARVEAAMTGRRRKEMLDLLVVGGESLATIVAAREAPAAVEAAFELAYPGLEAVHGSFANAVRAMDVAELPGLVNGVKGKLFEIELVDYLNTEGLPPGYEASLAESSTQAGWDLQVTGPDGAVADLLQAKATQSVAYVRDALERYPAIDVYTTSEVHAQLVALGAAEGVSGSHITEADLEEAVNEAIDVSRGSVELGDFIPSELGLAILALSSFMGGSASWEERGAEFGNRAAQAGIAGGLASVAMVVTQTWWIALAAGVGSRWLAGGGRTRRAEYESLIDALVALRRVELRDDAAGAFAS